jgi:hypothetical protein
MKKTFLFLFFLCAFTIYQAQAQAQDTLTISSQQLNMVILDKIDHEVSLTQQQREEVIVMLTERSEQIQKAMAHEKSNIPTKNSFKGLNDQAYHKLKKVLTEEQYNRLRALREETRKQKGMYATEEVYQSEQDLILDF